MIQHIYSLTYKEDKVQEGQEVFGETGSAVGNHGDAVLECDSPMYQM